MDIEAFREYCLQKKGVTEELPFGPDTLVFKVMGKMFALMPLNTPTFKISLKCDPERAIALRENYPNSICGAYHMNKKHWNSLEVERLTTTLVSELTTHSYALVVKKLPKKLRVQLASCE